MTYTLSSAWQPLGFEPRAHDIKSGPFGDGRRGIGDRLPSADPEAACSRVRATVNCWNETFPEAYRVDERGGPYRRCDADDIRTGEG
jgi:hypothetical protein